MAQQEELQRLLDLCDEIRALRRRMQDGSLQTETLSRLKRRSRERLKRLAEELSTFDFRGSLKDLVADLDPRHFLILATLLRRHLRASTPYVEGRALLCSVFDSSYELLQGLEYLLPEGLLRANGLMLVEHDEDATGDHDLLECRFRLSDAVVEGFLDELDQGRARRAARTRSRAREQVLPYRDQNEFLVDLRLLHNLYRARAKRIFSPDSWWRLRPANGDRAQRAVERRIAAFEARIEQRLRKSPQGGLFPIQRFVAEFGLNRRELLIVLHLLFLELLEGNPYADVVALLQLVSSNEEELIENKRLFAEQSSLRRCNIVELDQMLEGRELTSECHLVNWVAERLLGEEPKRGPIDADERLNFHLYLKRLGSSSFLQDF